jgi:hypothetical protein
MRTESSSMNTSTSRNARELRPYSPNEMNDLLQVCNASFVSSKAVEMAETEYLDNDVMIHREDGPANLLPHREVPVSARSLLEGEEVVSKKDEPKGIWNIPDTEATLTLPSHSPTFSLRAILSHPSKDEPPPLLLTETEPLQPPETKTVVSKEEKSAKLCSPLCLANPMPLRRSAPVSPKSAVLHLSKDKTSPSVKSVPIRCEPSIINTSQTTRVSTHQTLNEAHSQVPNTAARERFNNASFPISSRNNPPTGEVRQLDRAVKVPGCPVKHPMTVKECSLTHSTDTQQLAFKQVQSSKSPGEMEEERQADVVVNKIDKDGLSPGSPKCLPNVMPPTHSHVPQAEMTSFCHLLDESKPSGKTAVKRRAYSIVVSENNGKAFSAVKSSEAIELAEVKCLDNDVMICREDAGVLPPSHGEASVLKRLLIEGKAIVNKKTESSALRHAPTAEAALTLPIQSPITPTTGREVFQDG